MSDYIKDMTDEELKNFFELHSRQLGNSIRYKIIWEELLKRSLKLKEDE